jgi:hypothetical protein
MEKALVDVIIEDLKKGEVNVDFFEKIEAQEDCQEVKEILLNEIKFCPSLLKNLSCVKKDVLFALLKRKNGFKKNGSQPSQVVNKYSGVNILPSFRCGIYERKDMYEFIYRFLLKQKDISFSTTMSNFRKLFSGDAVEEKIIWTGKLKDLCYLIKHLFPGYHQHLWVITSQCFIFNKAGKIINLPPRKLGGVDLPDENIILDTFIAELEMMRNKIKIKKSLNF